MSQIGYAYMWEYLVKPGRAEEFERLYGPDGRWVGLFSTSVGYVRTELHRDRDDPNRYLTIDYWASEEAWREWRAGAGSDYDELDALGAGLTISEREVGRFEPVRW